ncbi:unnamed protein product [Enterobius vermicularis]|uniref:Transposase n=1 Tax=Enterobius vermicularis TaxID=51028 RepID=A0A0N4UU69_ENTVE|nr:unnamed protein product [Enterobius vermicularis]
MWHQLNPQRFYAGFLLSKKTIKQKLQLLRKPGVSNVTS